MKAIIFEEINQVAVADVEKPSIEHPDDAIVKVTLSSICGSDIHMIHGAAPMMPGTILGHEFVGVVEECGEGIDGFAPGDRVAVACTVQCGKCEMCQKGLAAKCKKGGVFGCGPFLGNFDGAQAEYIRVPYAQLGMHKIPPSLSDEQVLLVGDILSTGYFGVINGKICPGDSVVVFGAGPVGLCAIACATLFSPAKLIAVDPIPGRLKVARALGATHTIDPGKKDVIHEIQELTGGAPRDILEQVKSRCGADVVIEAVGIKSTFDACFQAVRPGGNVSIIGIFEDPQELMMPQLSIKNIGVSMGLVNVVHMDRLLRLIEAGLLDATPLITHRMSLEEGVKGYEMFQKRSDDVIKIALTP
ncbi:MAG: alcohol dehydrogenase [Candidatus Abyssobacteria bacterium SURF_5]|uniref:Alcohol dehydrogenase n=1 Tax=Abyssobacteria bacterium (strain SURF_5) TaxID=2093360 RepID=A0A3A4P1Z1_ABYX5|nr:MAG: alcohol dehydrogenase [Candidatus Abyssubacteria bacterium SURF_5]